MRLRTMANVTLVMTSALFAASSDAAAAKPWIERPLSLETLHAQIQAGVGFGQYTDVSGSSKFGMGSNLEAAIGLPFFGELSLRTGYRFGNPGRAAQADYYARLFDHETANMGNAAWANPEIRLRGSIVDLEVAGVGLETRFVVPLADGSNFSIAPGLPVVFRIPKLARIDTGIFVPIAFNDQTQYTISVPAQLWFQVDDFFFGPMTGIRYNRIATINIDTTGAKTNSSTTRTDIPLGIGGGYTIGGMFDIKAQLYMLRVNDSDWSRTIGGGLGVAVLLP
jgi:hypothetical protein